MIHLPFYDNNMLVALAEVERRYDGLPKGKLALSMSYRSYRTQTSPTIHVTFLHPSNAH